MGGGDGRVDGFGIGIDAMGEQGATAGAMGGEGISAFGEAPFAADEEAKIALARSEPFLGDGVGFGGGAVGEGFVDVLEGHGDSPFIWWGYVRGRFIVCVLLAAA